MDPTEITFKIKQPETSEESIINTIILLIRDIKQFQGFKTSGDYETYKETHNKLVDSLLSSVRQMYI